MYIVVDQPAGGRTAEEEVGTQNQKPTSERKIAPDTDKNSSVMDQLGKSMNNLSLWEVKSYVRKAQNAVLNLSDVEAKVREATNNEPWGASTTLMSEIARGTFNYRDREEICNMIFRRFTEKSAHEWRQIYKSLQLMEYLVKNGSERFVDDARANVSLVSMLKSFHYIDSKGVDQGINIRNRAKELTNLLNDEAKIRQERKKAKENSKKFDAISSTSAGSRNLARRTAGTGRRVSSGAADFDDDGYENRIFGDGGVFGERFEEARGTSIAPGAFEEYDEGQHHSNSNNTNSNSNNNRNGHSRMSKASVEASRVNARGNADLLGFGDDFGSTNGASNGGFHDNAGAEYENDNDNDGDDDDFDDFQSATPAASASAAAPTNTATNSNNLADLLTSSYSTNNYYGASTTSTAAPTPAIGQPKKDDDIFGSLLMSAKQTQTSSTRPATSKPLPTLAAAPPSRYAAATPAPKPSSNNNNGIVDLLDL